MEQLDDRDHGLAGFPLPDSHLRKALWRLSCALILFWGAWASAAGHWYADAPGGLRLVLSAVYFAIAVGMTGQAFSEWKKHRSRGAGPAIERIESPR